MCGEFIIETSGNMSFAVCDCDDGVLQLSRGDELSLMENDVCEDDGRTDVFFEVNKISKTSTIFGAVVSALESSLLVCREGASSKQPVLIRVFQQGRQEPPGTTSTFQNFYLSRPQSINWINLC